MAWEIVVGVETHAQLLTASKMFSGAATAFGAAPNTQASAVDIALPGVLPVANKGAVELAVRFGIAVNGTINRRSVFARKNYFYPDLPKGYQISQYEQPIVQGGGLRVVFPDRERTVRLTRAHLEEDAGKSIHGEAISGVLGHGALGYMVLGNPLVNEERDLTKLSAIDLNRAGTPLLEIVSEPELRGAAEAVAYARTLHALVRWIGVCDGNMQEGSFRCDANVSVRRVGETKLGTRCEIKNLNSFRFMEQAIEFEAKRQIEILEDGGSIAQQTRLYDPDKNETRSMRTKEDAQDYRYFPDPDLLPLVIDELFIAELKRNLPELPDQRRERYMKERGLSAYDASVLTSNREISDFFEEMEMHALKNGESLAFADLKNYANWVINDIAPRMHEEMAEENLQPWAFRVGADTVGHIIRRVREGKISAKTGKTILADFWNDGRRTSKESGQYRLGGYPERVDEIIQEKGLDQISDTGAIEKIVDEVLAANAKQVADYRGGKEKAFNSLVGQVMKRSQGKANPAQVNEILRRQLKG